MNSLALAELKKLSEKIATELVFAQPDSDAGLLPVNSLLGEMEEVLAEQGPAEPFHQAVLQARACVSQTLEGAGAFTPRSLEWLGQWVAWWPSAMGASDTAAPAQPFTLDWGLAQEPPAPTAATAATQDEPALGLNLEQDRELLGEFIQEAHEHLLHIEQEVLVLEEHPAEPETLNAIFRAFHTVKGGSGFLNLTVMQNLAHDLESLLDLARQHQLAVTPEVITLILEGGDALKRFTTEINLRLSGQNASAPIRVPTRHLTARIRQVLQAQGQAPLTAEAPAIQPPGPPARSSDGLGAPTVLSPEPPAELASPPATRKPSAAALSSAGLTSTVKVDTNKLDCLVDLIGEMVIAQSLVAQNRDDQAHDNERFVRDLAQLRRITKDLQRTAMSLRMVPVQTTFQKMHRLVRDISGKVGKRVQLLTDGDETELDRTIVEEISDPLIHMVRNSVDHGIEKPGVRTDRGKPAQGTIWLKAFHQGGNIVIEVQDDGQGLDRARILAKACEKGLAQRDEVLSDEQIFGFILAPGFSTAEKVTELSGRGVGLDVVRRNIEKLRGKIEIQSKTGQGTTFRIYLPLTLAIIDGLVVSVGESCYIVPTLLVRESFRPAAGMIHTVQGRGEMVNVRGKLRPLLRLYDLLGIRPASKEPTQSIVLVLEAGAEARCVMVDKLLGKQEVVIKSLGETFQRSRFLAGAAILGDGRVGLILDPQALVHLEAAPLEEAA